MDDDNSQLCKAISKWFAELRAEIYREPPHARPMLKAMADAYCKTILARARAGVLTWEDWTELALQVDVVRSVRAKNRTLCQYLSRLHFEWAAFADQLATRQATHIPNWDAFYAARARLEEKIDRGDLT
jgi:hypothetical protein